MFAHGAGRSDRAAWQPVAVEGSNFVIEADAVVPAIGQVCDLSYIQPESGVQTTRWNTVIANDRTFQVDDKPIFTGGDCFFSPLTLIAAIASGKNAGEVHGPIHGKRFLQAGKRRLHGNISSDQPLRL